MKEPDKSIWAFRISSLVASLILLCISFPQDEAPLLFQGILLNEYFFNAASPLFSVYEFNNCYTSWGGVLLSLLGIKLFGTAGAAFFLRLVHLSMLIVIFRKLEKRKYLLTENLPLFWSLLPLVFGSYIFSKGFYNFLFALDLTVIALLLPDSKSIQKIYVSVLLLLAALCHPLPVMLSCVVPLLLKSFKKYILWLPAFIPVMMHLMHTQGETHWDGYRFIGRIYILVTGLSLDSAHIYEFIFSIPLFLGGYFLYMKKVSFKKMDLTWLPMIFVLIGIIAPTETSGGGLIAERLFWMAWILACIIWMHQYEINRNVSKYIYITILFFVGFKTILGMVAQKKMNPVCQTENTASPRLAAVRLWSVENPDRSDGWLIPFSTLAFRKQPLEYKQVDWQNHFAWYGYYPFTYNRVLLEDELYNVKHIRKIKQSEVKYIWTDVNIADPDISLVKTCSESSIKLYHIER